MNKPNGSPVISSSARDPLACGTVASTGDPSSQAPRDDRRAVTNKRLIWNFELDSSAPLVFEQHPTDSIIESERWESRFFWPENKIIVLRGFPNTFLNLAQFNIKYRQDRYCLLSNTNENIKIRRDQLLYKPELAKTSYAVAYGAKIKLDETLSDQDIKALRLRIQKTAQCIDVNKETLIHTFPTTPKVKVELARLEVFGQIWFSVSIESRAKYWVELIAKHLFNDQQSYDYVTFLKQLRINE